MCVLATGLFLFTQCQPDENPFNGNNNPKGEAQFEITDSPSDDPNVESAFVTVAAVKVDGEVISSFSGKQTIDLLAYQNGNTKVLGLGELEVGTYSNVSLVLDYSADANGTAPGCYVQTKDGQKHALSASSEAEKELSISGNFEVEAESQTNIVMDFDVRKAITRAEANAESNYSFVTDSEVKSSIRLVAKAQTGKIKGKCEDTFDYGGDKIVVYAYKKGTFNKDAETSGQGSSNIFFKNAVASASVDASGNYTLAFLEEGEYEVHYVAYEDSDNDGQTEIKGMLELDLLASLGLNLNNIKVEAGVDLSLDVTVTGILPL